MTAIELKAHLYSLIEQEDSVEKLEAVEALLSGQEESQLSARQIEEIRRGIAQGEGGIAAGRVYTREEVEAQIKQPLRNT